MNIYFKIIFKLYHFTGTLKKGSSLIGTFVSSCLFLDVQNVAWKDRKRFHTLTLERTALKFGFSHFFMCVFVVAFFFYFQCYLLNASLNPAIKATKAFEGP